MSNKMYPIQSGAVTLYVDLHYDGTIFKFMGFTVNGDSSFYQPQVYTYDDAPIAAGMSRVSLDQFLFKKYKILADEQIRTYLDLHIRDMSIYADRGRRFINSWYNIGREPFFELYKGVRYNQILDGIVGLDINGIICLYDFVNNQTAGYRKACTGEMMDVTPMYVFYNRILTQRLALEQYKYGFAPPFYTELVRLTQFLAGKRSVKLVMKNGNVHEYKYYSDHMVSTGDLLRFDPENISEPFLLENSYDLKPRFSGNIPVAELDFLQNGRDKHYIDSDALKDFGKDRQTKSVI